METFVRLNIKDLKDNRIRGVAYVDVTNGSDFDFHSLKLVPFREEGERKQEGENLTIQNSTKLDGSSVSASMKQSEPGKPKKKATGQFPCPHPGCSSVLKRKDCLKRHLDDVHGERTQCPKCGRNSTKSEGRRHIRKCVGKKITLESEPPRRELGLVDVEPDVNDIDCVLLEESLVNSEDCVTEQDAEDLIPGGGWGHF